MAVKSDLLFIARRLSLIVSKEVWKDVLGYEGLYKVSDLGNIISLPRKGTIKTEKLLKPKIDKDGYLCVTLYKNNTRKSYHVHRIVAMSFINNYDNLPQVNHIDGNKQNNNINNLEWCTNQENIQHAWEIGLKKRRYGKDNDKSKTVYQYSNELELINIYESTRDAERKTGFNHSHIAKCCNNKYKTVGGYKWSYVNESEVV